MEAYRPRRGVQAALAARASTGAQSSSAASPAQVHEPVVQPIVGVVLAAADDEAANEPDAPPPIATDGDPDITTPALPETSFITACDAAAVISKLRPWTPLKSDAASANTFRMAIVRKAVDLLYPLSDSSSSQDSSRVAGRGMFAAIAAEAAAFGADLARIMGVIRRAPAPQTVAVWLNRCARDKSTSEVSMDLSAAASKRCETKCPIRGLSKVGPRVRGLLAYCTEKGVARFRGAAPLTVSAAHAMLQRVNADLLDVECRLSAGALEPAQAAASSSSSSSSSAGGTSSPPRSVQAPPPVDAEAALLGDVLGDDAQLESGTRAAGVLRAEMLEAWSTDKPQNVPQAASLAAVAVAEALRDEQLAVPAIRTFYNWASIAGYGLVDKTKCCVYNNAHERGDAIKMRSVYLGRRKLLAEGRFAGRAPSDSGRVFLVNPSGLNDDQLAVLVDLVSGSKSQTLRVEVADAAMILAAPEVAVYNPETDRIAIEVFHDEAILRADCTGRKVLVHKDDKSSRATMSKGVSPGIMISGFIHPTLGTLAFQVVESASDGTWKMQNMRTQLDQVARMAARSTRCLDCLFVVDRSSNHCAKGDDAIVASNFLVYGNKVAKGKPVLMRNTTVRVGADLKQQSLNYIRIAFGTCSIKLEIDWRAAKEPGVEVSYLESTLGGGELVLHDGDPEMDRLREALQLNQKDGLDAALAEIVEKHRVLRQGELVASFEANYLDFTDIDGDSSESWGADWAAGGPEVRSTVVTAPLGVCQTSWGTRPAIDILRERYPGDKWGELEVAFGFSGSPSGKTILQIFSKEPDVVGELPSICHTVIAAAEVEQGAGPRRVGMRVTFLPVAHAELNPIELLWATLRSCRKSDVVTERRTSKDPGKMAKLRQLVALMMSHVSPSLIKRFYRHVNRIEELYDGDRTGPEVMKLLTAERRGQRRQVTTFDWGSHWVPPLITGIVTEATRHGEAHSILLAVREFSMAQNTAGYSTSRAAALASDVLGHDMSASEWNGYMIVKQ